MIRRRKQQIGTHLPLDHGVEYQVVEWTGAIPHVAPDTLAFVIPFSDHSNSPQRVKGLQTVVDYLRVCQAFVVVVHAGPCPVSAGGNIHTVEAPPAEVFSKSKLINVGINYLLAEFPAWQWLIQLDADILTPMTALVADLASVSENCNVAMPWRHWIRLTPAESSLVRDFPRAPRTFRQVLPRRIKGSLGVGGLTLRRRLLEDGFRWDESYVNWGWEDTDAADKALCWYGVRSEAARGSAVGVHLWHENDRVVQPENGARFLGGSLPDAHHGGALLEAKTKFLLVTQGRCGGHLLGRSLDEHPEIYCNSAEPFIHATFTPPIISEATRFKDWTMLQALRSDKPVVGMRVQYTIESKSFDFDTRAYLRWAITNDFHLIHLVRRCSTDVAISNILARASTLWVGQRYPDELVYVDPKSFSEFWLSYEMEKRSWIPELATVGALLVYYEDLIADWSGCIRQIQQRLGVRDVRLPQVVERQTQKAHLDYISNRQEIVELIQQLEQSTHERRRS